MNYREWQQSVSTVTGLDGLFYLIIDANWAPAEQNELARLWKSLTDRDWTSAEQDELARLWKTWCSE